MGFIRGGGGGRGEWGMLRCLWVHACGEMQMQMHTHTHGERERVRERERDSHTHTHTGGSGALLGALIPMFKKMML